MAEIFTASPVATQPAGSGPALTGPSSTRTPPPLPTGPKPSLASLSPTKQQPANQNSRPPQQPAVAPKSTLYSSPALLAGQPPRDEEGRPLTAAADAACAEPGAEKGSEGGKQPRNGQPALEQEPEPVVPEPRFPPPSLRLDPALGSVTSLLGPAANKPPSLSASVSLLPGCVGGRKPVAADSMSCQLDSVSMISGTQESLAGFGLGDDASSMGSDSEINGMTFRKTDKYGFLGGTHLEAGERELKVDVARQRELKWLDMFSHWDKWVSRRLPKVKLRCRKGIPSSLRAKAWQLLSNSKELMDENPGKFEELERDPGDPKWLDIIEKDLHRQFPFHEMFAARGGHGQQDLYRILKAYTVYRPEEGYCQAQAPVAAVLLMHMPAEQAFWCLVQVCEKYLPGYYSAGLEAIQLDGEIFFSLLKKVSPMAYRHLHKFKIDPILYMTEWFMCVFSRTLPWACVLRVWDMFFCEGVKIIFRVGLVLLRQILGSVDKLRDCQGMYETMEKLRSIPPEYMREETLVHEVISLPVTESLIERENAIQLKKWRQSRGELQHKHSRRLHGTRAIQEERQRGVGTGGGGGLLRASASLLSLPGLRRSKEDRPKQPPLLLQRGMVSPSHSVSSLVVSSSTSSATKLLPAPPQASEKPPPSPQVVSEGLRPSLPSPTANNSPLATGSPTPALPSAKKAKEERKREKEKEKQQKEREKQQKEREKEKEKQQKERERLDKEREKRQAKERAREEAKEKRKQGKRKEGKEEVSSPPPPPLLPLPKGGEKIENGAQAQAGGSKDGPEKGPQAATADPPSEGSPAASSAGALEDTYV
ncbi:TBC1 domain family member 10A-like [Polyodon spathula]|uniref:TBC1 domain family member 10A-like n=1 Tax=Polyodon spathula TaxID=7913 RepID=UPI001B7DBCEE|nr:TBC1 domain family member 10A-like [Polyodon spathula]